MPELRYYPTTAELTQWQQGGLLADMNRAMAPKPAFKIPTTPGAATPLTGAATSSLPGYTSTTPTAVPQTITPTLVPQPTPIDLPGIPQNDPSWIAAMTEMVNNLNLQAQGRANAARIPGAMGLESLSSGNIKTAMQGQLPADVIRQLGQASAERGVMSGNPYGASTNANYLRSIGLNSLQMMNTGQDWLTAALGRNPSAPIFDPSGLIITPAQQGALSMDRANIALNQQRASTDVWNMNAGRQMEASLQNARNQMEVENANAQRKLQSDLANASNQLERDRLVWQYEQNRLNRENALRLAQMEAASKAAGYGRGAGGGGNQGGGGGSFAPATNWGGGTQPITTPWNLPNFQTPSMGTTAGSSFTPGTYTDQMNPLYGYTQTPGLPNTVPGGSPWTPPPFDTGGLDDILGGGAINDAGMSQEELDWLYNVGG